MPSVPHSSVTLPLLTCVIDAIQLAGPDMLIDTYDQYAQQDNEVVDTTPDDASEEQGEAALRADDCELRRILIQAAN